MPVKKHKGQKKAKKPIIVEQSLFDSLQASGEAESEDRKENLNPGFSAVAKLLTHHPIKKHNKYISQEFQAFGCHMATVLGDQAHTSLYIKLAKTYPRALLEQALAFVSDAESARSKAKLFMWKLNLLKKSKNKE
jgi:hypothetical protein